MPRFLTGAKGTQIRLPRTKTCHAAAVTPRWPFSVNLRVGRSQCVQSWHQIHGSGMPQSNPPSLHSGSSGIRHPTSTPHLGLHPGRATGEQKKHLKTCPEVESTYNCCLIVDDQWQPPWEQECSLQFMIFTAFGDVSLPVIQTNCLPVTNGWMSWYSSSGCTFPQVCFCLGLDPPKIYPSICPSFYMLYHQRYPHILTIDISISHRLSNVKPPVFQRISHHELWQSP